MRSLLLTLAFAFGSLTVIFSACGTAPKCSATTCPTGCCDSSGLCQTTGSSSACGSRGASCTVCGVTASCVAGSCMQNISGSGTGGGTAGTGGGTAGTGGGTAGTGGGTASTGGGTASTGGGSSGTGGGSSGTGGGSSGTGGGSSGTGGGSSGTGGGASGTGGGSSGTGGGSSGSEAMVFCARLGSAMNRFFAGRPSCGSGGLTLSNNFDAPSCVSGYGACTAFDKMALNAGTTCIEGAAICSSGNDMAAINSIGPCLATLSDISQSCAAAMGFE
ncbi:MAG: hypothetical protein IAE78_31830 [Myxococcus sp.]|nr:hypothetical protein [Myxococcus sp.]